MVSSLLEVSGISVIFDGFKAIDNLSFEIGHRELKAIIGPNGAGKTTFMDLITGKTSPIKGSIKWGVNNVDLLTLNEAKIAQLGIGRKFQKPTVFEEQTVFENLVISLRANRSVVKLFFSEISDLDKIRVSKIAREIGLEEYLMRLSGELSHGQKQWLEIGMLLIQEPKLLLVDEPAAGMTPDEREKTTAILSNAARHRAVIVVEHDMDFVRRLNCNVTVLNEGSIIVEGSINHVTSDQVVQEVYLGR